MGASALHSFQGVRLRLNSAWPFCKCCFAKARTKQEYGSLPVPTRKEQTACGAGLKAGGVELTCIVLFCMQNLIESV